jgi:hypothetical protein
MQPDHLMADAAFGIDGVKSASAQEPKNSTIHTDKMRPRRTAVIDFDQIAARAG